MTHTGHKNPRAYDNRTLVEWVTPTIEEECRFYNIEMPTPKQIAAVISSVRMHSIIMHAASYDISELGKPDEVSEFWPMQSSIGRYFRDAARITLDEEAHEQ